MGPNVVCCLSCLVGMFLKVKYPEVKKTEDAECAAAIKNLESLMTAADAQKLGRLTAGRTGAEKLQSLVTKEADSLGQGSRAYEIVEWLARLAKLRNGSEAAAPLVDMESGAKTNTGDTFKFGGASGFAGGCATYGSAGTG